ncbi:MAG: chemotaxis-specific protein-glutamate methyltransferase CheB [Lachnospiraceae bacterium]|nr:chemotaxis-specific protein-glutamate methyltransferase CheB [Lachnospiraceae bacterium]
MQKNVLIIDDSALMRRRLSGIIDSDKRFKVVDIARNGEVAMSLISKNPQKYDIIILDFFMPDKNGDEILREINKLHIDAYVILISGVIKKDAMEVIEALENGAFDFVTKPTDIAMAKDADFSERIIQCIELAASAQDEERVRKASRKIAQKETPIFINKKRDVKQKGSVRGDKLVALACSTGGPKALHQVIPKLSKALDAPMIIVQHMPKGFTNSLAVRLNEVSEINVKEAENGDVLEKGMVYIAKGGAQLRVAEFQGKYVLKLTDEPARNGLRPCADIMYESLCESEFKEIICVVLTGMGADGTEGIKKLSKNNNIYSIAQDAESCTVYGMPKAFFESGLVDEVRPIQDIARAIEKRVGVR